MKRKRECSACVWALRDPHDLSSRQRVCYSENSPRYRRDLTGKELECKVFERRLKGYGVYRGKKLA